MTKEQFSSALTGTYRVIALRAARTAVQRLLPKASDCMELRSQVLKLRYWPEKNPTDDSGQLLDLHWGWVKSLRGSQIGELRIRDTIGGRDNLRVIFAVLEKADADPMPMIWVLHVMQKKRMQFSAADLEVFRARKQMALTKLKRTK